MKVQPKFKLDHTYHGPYRVYEATSTNVKVKPVTVPLKYNFTHAYTFTRGTTHIFAWKMLIFAVEITIYTSHDTWYHACLYTPCGITRETYMAV